MKRKVVQVSTKINYSRETYNSLSPILWLLKLFAIDSNIDSGCHTRFLKTFRMLLAMVILGGLNLYSFYYKLDFVYEKNVISPSIKFTDTLQTLYDLGQYIVDLWFVYKYGKNITSEYYQQYTYIDPILNMTDYETIKRKLTKLLGFFTFIWFTSTACDYVAWYFVFGWITSTVYGVSYIFLYIKILTTLDLSAHVMHIEIRLKIIGDIVHYYYLITEELPGYIGDFISNKNWLYSKDCSASIRHSHPIKLQATDECDKIKWLTRCYLQLTEQVEFINCMFGFRILLNSLSLVIDIIRFTNIAVRVALGTQMIPSNLKYYPAMSNLMRQMNCILLFVSLVRHCESVYSEHSRIKNIIDHLLVNRNPCEKLRAAMTEFRGLVQERPMNFNLAKFFRLDNGFLVSITSVVVTYTIILLQSI